MGSIYKVGAKFFYLTIQLLPGCRRTCIEGDQSVGTIQVISLEASKFEIYEEKLISRTISYAKFHDRIRAKIFGNAFPALQVSQVRVAHSANYQGSIPSVSEYVPVSPSSFNSASLTAFTAAFSTLPPRPRVKSVPVKPGSHALIFHFASFS